MLDDMNPITTTYQKILLNDWQAVAVLFRTYGTPLKDQLDPEKNTTNNQLTDRIIHTALMGPFQHCLRLQLKVHATATRLHLEYKYRHEEAFNQEGSIQDYDDGIDDDDRSSITETTVNALKQKATELAQTQADAWKALSDKHTDSLINELMIQGVELTEIEQKEFKDPETVQDLFDRFTELKIELPKLKKRSEMTYSKFFTFKVKMAVHSSLSRRQLPNDDAAIEKTMKALKQAFKELDEAEKILLETHSAEVDEALQHVSFAVPTRQKKKTKDAVA